ncbi:Olfactory receptor 14A16 [Manis javanica]|nr:Olfactory receptor 14A16 [Manis javanica]
MRSAPGHPDTGSSPRPSGRLPAPARDLAKSSRRQMSSLDILNVHSLSGAVAYLKPASELKSIVDLVLSVFYTVVPPSVNPVIYSLRNKDIKVALGKLLVVLNLSLDSLAQVKYD